YVRSKVRSCEECGIESKYLHLDKNISQQELLQTLHDLNTDSSVHGILLQLPIPKQLNSDEAIAAIDPLKDVDGFHPQNLGMLVAGKPRFVPCTPLGIKELLIRNGVKTEGKRTVVLGRSVIVGKPMALLLAVKGEGADATVTICHSRTKNLAEHTSRADIIIAAMGRAQLISGDMVGEGVVIVDVGMNRIEDATMKKGYRLVGDVDFASCSAKASFITPVPGGVGPMTVAMLMSNTLKAYNLQAASGNAHR
ncbi:MAG: bifunctional 5,10-methylenetetrahydrofolate dehydrogenase/5,10-methenyltetrahydrofolate cyclohydrolase, partial [Candidatus Latescibacterota bacterium]